MATANECRERLERAGWFGEEACVIGPEGASWEVSVARGGDELFGEGASPEEAWQDARGAAEFAQYLEGIRTLLRPGPPD